MASEQIHCSQNFFPFVFMLMFSPYFASVPTLSTLHCVSYFIPASTLPLAFLLSLHVSSSFPLLPLPVPSPTCTCFPILFFPYPYMYVQLPLLYLLQKNAGVFPPLIAIYVFVCSLYTLNILCVLFCSVLLSSHGPDGPELFMIDPSGVSWVKKYIYLIFCIMAKNVVIHVGIKLLILYQKKNLQCTK